MEGTVAGGGVEEGENVDDCEWFERSDDGFGKTVSHRPSVQNCLMLLYRYTGGGVEEGENVDDCEWLERSDDGQYRIFLCCCTGILGVPLIAQVVLFL